MKKVEIKGIIPPIITPMNADESINVPVLRQQVERQIENGVHALFCFGPNGEGYIRISLTTPDDRLLEAARRIKEAMA